MPQEFADQPALDPHIAYCGLDCSVCEVYRATAYDSDELRQTHAAKVLDQFKIEVEPANVNCHGCRDVRPKIGFCAWCQVRSCALERGVENCAVCPDYACEKLDQVQAAMISLGKDVDGVASAKINLEAIRRDRRLS